jgi:1-deoxy-D-xylulose-5-phosphate reductoisomerase
MSTAGGLARRIAILGATGSIGQSTAAVIEELRGQGCDLEVEAIVGGARVPELAAMARRLRPKFVAAADPALLQPLRDALTGEGFEIGAGPEAVVEAAERPSDWVMSAIVGAAALAPTLAALKRGATTAMANKECMVCAGDLMRATASKHGARLLPVDSEHNAIFQVLGAPERVEKVTLTASGGPFRTWTRQQMAGAGPEQACAHPTWSMGAKISVDSATLMNKGLELIEAAYLFDLADDKLDVLVHPQSIIHSLVSYCDGSVLAQLSSPDMRVPISYALAWPDRAPVSTARLDLAAVAQLTFEAPDMVRFPALRLARAALRAGGAAPTALNAANETAVAAFLNRRIGFLDIARTVEDALESLTAVDASMIAKSPSSFAEVMAVDQAARRAAATAMVRAAA